ncbi:MAG: hypothetical protein II812_05310 [Prevotella sp.]|nr:hypothetical protein [Prevotella sp.]
MSKIIIAFLLLLSCTTQGAVKKTNLSVLYVGGNSNIDGTSVKVDRTVIEQSIMDRTASFDTFLRTYFKEVKVVKDRDYKCQMSDSYDVTIIDGSILPLNIEELETAYKEKRQAPTPIFFPDGFSRPVITIAEVSPAIGRSFGYKADWFCQCLDADAHTFDKTHPIFNKPYKVKLTMREKPTPEGAEIYAAAQGIKLSPTTPMWQVQKKGYITDPGFKIGMVSRPSGFNDSPDAESISGGVSTKSIDAVAIGRHGSFLHWGFSASPSDMTEEAKVVFANAIVYISNYAGHKIIARKLNDRIQTRFDVDMLAFSVSKEAYDHQAKQYTSHNKMALETQKVAKEKQAKGEALTSMESMFLNFKPISVGDYPSFLRSHAGRMYETFGDDITAYKRYYEENMPYFYGGMGLSIDEDVKSLGIDNHDKRLLDKAISMLENNTDVEKALRILKRYTLCRYDNAADWRNWYNRYADKLFFTESGGWLFLVNSQDPSTPGNDYSILKKEQAQMTRQRPSANGDNRRAPRQNLTTSDEKPVAAAVFVRDVAEGKKEVMLRVKIHEGYHIYGVVSDQDPYIPTTIEILPPEGCELDGQLQQPTYRVLNSTGTTVYEGDIIFRQQIKGDGKGAIKCKINFQCCDESICFPPQEIVVNTQIR